ncbi:MAG TPA: SIMPL domain-containing protein [Solirubrobacteraceae bacterium]|nr:SIMPL domain-containing protein [Solirubrobacteraceae bacterium]
MALLAAAPAAAQQTAADREGERSITVGGEGGVFADNDVALFNVAVTTRRRTATAALRANSFALRRVRGALRGEGIEPKDLETDVVSLDRVRPRRGGRTFYVARNGVSVTVRDLDNAGEVIDAAVRAGATNVYGPSFGLADPKAVYRDALGIAFADARAKAERLAREAGLTLGPVLRVRESGIEDLDFTRSGAGFDEAAGQVESGTPPISRGRTQVTAEVVVTFAAS